MRPEQAGGIATVDLANDGSIVVSEQKFPKSQRLVRCGPDDGCANSLRAERIAINPERVKRDISKRRGCAAAVILSAALTWSCGDTKGADNPVTRGGAPAVVAGGGAGGGGAGGLPGSGGLVIEVPNGGARQGEGSCAATGPLADGDHDGFTVQAGDCNDCDPAINPGAFDFEGNGFDEDCSGTPDDEAKTCDSGLPMAADDAMDAAKALGLCRKQVGQSWGVIAARWVFPNGEPTSRVAADDDDPDFTCTKAGLPTNPESRGILPSFGANVLAREGASLVALSTGVARAGLNSPHDPGEGQSPVAAAMCTENVAPAGFPKDSPACPDVTTAQNTRARDAVALELEIKTPTNARALAYDFDFYTYEWPEYVCSEFNDFFVALLKSSHASTPLDENISFDKLGNPVSVNNGFVEVCEPAVGRQSPGGKSFDCALGTSELVGTGFDAPQDMPGEDEELPLSSSHAATGWLSTTAAIVPGETIRLRFAIWDMLDESLDSTVLLDHFTWALVAPTTPVTERPPKVR